MEGVELTQAWERLTNAAGEIAEIIGKRKSIEPFSEDELRRRLAAAKDLASKANIEIAQLLAKHQ